MTKQTLLPVRAPWMISASVPHLKLQTNGVDAPVSATFIGYFQCDDLRQPNTKPSSSKMILDPREFSTAMLAEDEPFHLVRVTFREGKLARVCPSFSDTEVILEADFDWSHVPTGLLPDERIEDNILRVKREWIESQMCPDPRMYEVENSSWMAHLGISGSDLKHYILVGHDDYLEVIAKGWSWEKGQSIT